MLVVGGGTGGTAAGIQSARLGAKTIMVDSTPWLGGMLTAAGVSATDGNNRLPSGIWQEFREAIWKRYRGPRAVSTGWVSKTCFQPRVADSIFKSMAAQEKKLKVIYNYWFLHVLKSGDKVTGAIFTDNKKSVLIIYARVIIDATELGDVFKDAGAGYDVGMEARSYTGEPWALDSGNDIIQDITWVATLKDYGPGTDKTIPRPATYDSSMFFCSCKTKLCPNAEWTPQQMLDYGRLPDHEYMINWPIHGNDMYLNAINMNHEQRDQAYKAAKEKTLCFVYYIQHALGYKNLGLADDEYPTNDKLPFIPYNREGRRVKGIVRFTINDILHPYSKSRTLYRTAISVGDYPIDLHVTENPKAPKRTFPHIPSFGIPLGCLIPARVNGLIVADKGISVSNIVNGATRVTTCVMLTGQAAGVLAWYCSYHHVEPRDVNIRKIQEVLLDKNTYLLPFIDVTPSDPDFKAIQRMGVTGIIRGAGVPYNGANQTWFYPERPISQYELVQGLRDYYPTLDDYDFASGETLTMDALLNIFALTGNKIPLSEVRQDWGRFGFGKPLSGGLQLNRKMVAVLVDYYLHPFDRPIDFSGKLKYVNDKQG
ncbi:MAG: FAD-dependent oxidoreductase [Bacteroidetes bacterium]|nr:FAD-dependent oxidoreductase [Bacteroidota bacterium]